MIIDNNDNNVFGQSTHATLFGNNSLHSLPIENYTCIFVHVWIKLCLPRYKNQIDKVLVLLPIESGEERAGFFSIFFECLRLICKISPMRKAEPANGNDCVYRTHSRYIRIERGPLPSVLPGSTDKIIHANVLIEHRKFPGKNSFGHNENRAHSHGYLRR